MENVEFKAELLNLETARVICARLGARHEGMLLQRDAYYSVSGQRLKRRECPGRPAQWIRYERPDIAAARVSEYELLSDEEAAARFGTDPGEPWATVTKVRDLYLLANVRIHLDEVEGLGSYLEFEAMVVGDHDRANCERAVESLRGTFAPVLGRAVAVGYADLLAAAADGEEGQL
jgi:adenylate cyclase, class 2